VLRLWSCVKLKVGTAVTVGGAGGSSGVGDRRDGAAVVSAARASIADSTFFILTQEKASSLLCMWRCRNLSLLPLIIYEPHAAQTVYLACSRRIHFRNRFCLTVTPRTSEGSTVVVRLQIVAMMEGVLRRYPYSPSRVGLDDVLRREAQDLQISFTQLRTALLHDRELSLVPASRQLAQGSARACTSEGRRRA
jgi:hypothetical protein